MRTVLHDWKPIRKGRWVSVPEFSVWRRVVIVLLVLFGVLVLSLVLPRVANAKAGCSTRSKTYEFNVVGVRVMWFRVSASGCWNEKNTKVTSFTIGVTGDSTIPYRYQGIIGKEPIGSRGSHMVGSLVTVRFDSCVPPFGCTSTWQPSARFILDSYGNWDLRP